MKPDGVYLSHMRDAIAKIERYLAGVDYETFIGNDMMIDAVVRELEIIGEAARNVSDEFQQRHPEIPWRGIISQRHFLAHEYGEVRQEKLWRVATVRIPELIAMLVRFLPPPAED